MLGQQHFDSQSTLYSPSLQKLLSLLTPWHKGCFASRDVSAPQQQKLVDIEGSLSFTNGRQKSKTNGHKGQMYFKTVNIYDIQYSLMTLQEAFEFCWSLDVPSRTQNFTIITQEKLKIEQMYIWNHMTTRLM